MVLGLVADDALGLTPLAFLAAGHLLRADDGHLRRGQLAAPGARRRIDVRPLRVRRALELHRRLGDPARLPDRDGDRRRRRSRTTCRSSGGSSTRASPRWRSRPSRSPMWPPRTCAGWAPTGSAWSCACRWSGSCCCSWCRGSRWPRTGTRARSPTPSSWARCRAWDQLLFATVVAGVALVGVEAASGLAGEVRVGRRGLRRVVGLTSITALVLFVCVSVAALMAAPGRRRPHGAGRPLRGGAGARRGVQFDPSWLKDAARAVVGVTVAASLIVAMNGQMLGIARLAYSLATNRQIPSLAGRLHEQRGTPYIAITLAAVIAFGLAIPHDLEFLAGIFAFGAMVTFSIAHVSVIVLRYRESGRRARSACRCRSRPGAARCRCRPCWARCSRSWPGSACWSCTRARASSAAPGWRSGSRCT